jgi:hypothetical protein
LIKIRIESLIELELLYSGKIKYAVTEAKIEFVNNMVERTYEEN